MCNSYAETYRGREADTLERLLALSREGIETSQEFRPAFELVMVAMENASPVLSSGLVFYAYRKIDPFNPISKQPRQRCLISETRCAMLEIRL